MQARSLRIFDQIPPTSRPVMPVDPVPRALPRAISDASRNTRDTASDLDQRLAGILTSAVGVGETVELAFRRKEHQLGELFATLSNVESVNLHRRLSNPRTGDRAAELFGRMTVVRRDRLLAFLASVNRRGLLRR